VAAATSVAPLAANPIGLLLLHHNSGTEEIDRFPEFAAELPHEFEGLGCALLLLVLQVKLLSRELKFEL
jgi:hypothetical protein